MTMRPKEVPRALLDDPTNPKVVHRLAAPDATYVPLNFGNPDLRRIMPWAGTRSGPEAVLDPYTRMGRYWRSEAFEVDEPFGPGEGVVERSAASPIARPRRAGP